jgi:tRNA wybutosine-synthesizing protein 4
LWISECVLIYLETDKSDAIIKWCAEFVNSSFWLYEQINPDDPFGRMMVDNLQVSVEVV